ncbi:MAG TPA: hypothetical protein RMH99_07925, partial [Sandaracinaceae bacterium LLY-WYZ-13_1]|nr:hypothetical protein [Sandaracinaceae bacterium LLY-WYZ-13_1]
MLLRCLLSLALVGASLVTGCGRHARRAHTPRSPGWGASASPGGNQPPGWVRVQPPTTGMTLSFPSRPSLDVQEGREEDGAGFRTISSRANTPYGTFGVIVSE